MADYLCITIRFLQPYSHGRTNGAEPEWPPSPLRMYQALVNAAAARWNERRRLEHAVPALAWLAQQNEPTIVAAAGIPSNVAYRLYVPDNVGDKIAKSWRSGNAAASIADYRIEKDVRTVYLKGEAVHYLYHVRDDAAFTDYLETLAAAVRSITHLGWGIDMVVGNATELTEAEAADLPGERWRPGNRMTGIVLRVPDRATLDALMTRHEEFLGRVSGGLLRPVPPLPASAYRSIGYRRGAEPEPRPWVAFSILKPDASGYGSFDTPRRCRDVAAWVRHATGTACADWPDVAYFVHGHHSADSADPRSSQRTHGRLMYLPLPTINHALRRVESVRRVLITAPPGFEDRIDWIRRRLVGEHLIAEAGGVVGLLNLLPTSDWVLRQYTGSSRVWSTTTPVIMPGFDDRNEDKAERLLRKAFAQAGLAPEMVAHTRVEWRAVGFRTGVDLARRYRVPASAKRYPIYHVRATFPGPVQGPLAVGGGRYRGLGLFASDERIT